MYTVWPRGSEGEGRTAGAGRGKEGRRPLDSARELRLLSTTLGLGRNTQLSLHYSIKITNSSFGRGQFYSRYTIHYSINKKISVSLHLLSL